MAIKPLDDRVLIKPTESEEKTASGIYLPEGAQEKPQTDIDGVEHKIVRESELLGVLE